MRLSFGPGGTRASTGLIGAAIIGILVAELVTAIAIIITITAALTLLVIGIRGLVLRHRARIGDASRRQQAGRDGQ